MAKLRANVENATEALDILCKLKAHPDSSPEDAFLLDREAKYKEELTLARQALKNATMS